MKKFATIIASALLAVVMALGLVACGGGGGGLSVYNGDENITGKTVNLYIGDSISFSLKSGDKAVSSKDWLCDKPSVVEKVNEEGQFKGLSEGTAKITVSYLDGMKNLQASFTINVTPDTSKKFDLKSKATDIAKEGVLTLSFYDNKAKLTGAIQGSYDFEERLDYNVSSSGVLTFTEIESAKATISPAAAATEFGALLPKEMPVENIKATVAGPYITITALTDSWDKEGQKDPIDLGTYELTAAQAEQLGVNIKGAISVTGITLNKTEITLDINEEYALVATVAPENATIKGYAYSSADSEKVTVDAATGKIKGVAKTDAPVTITVTTTDGNKTAECKVTVTDKTAKAFATNSNGVDITDTRIKFYDDGKVAFVGTHFGINVGLESTYTYEDNTLTIVAVNDKNVGSTEEPLVFDIAFAVKAVTGDESKIEVSVNATPAEGETQNWGKFIVEKSAFKASPIVTLTATSGEKLEFYANGKVMLTAIFGYVTSETTWTINSTTFNLEITTVDKYMVSDNVQSVRNITYLYVAGADGADATITVNGTHYSNDADNTEGAFSITNLEFKLSAVDAFTLLGALQ